MARAHGLTGCDSPGTSSRFSIFDRMGDIELTDVNFESGTAHTIRTQPLARSGPQPTIRTHRDEWQLFAVQQSQQFGREICWQEIAYWIIEERFPSVGNDGSFGQRLKEGIVLIQRGSTPTSIGETLMALYGQYGTVIRPTELLGLLTADRAPSG